MKSTFSYLLVLPFLLFLSTLHANDCSNAAVMTIGNPTAITLDACDNGDLAGGVWPACSACDQDAWFQLDMGGTNLVQQNMRFNIEANGSAELNLTLLYSDSWEESGDPCTWSNANAALGLSRNEWQCAQTITGVGDVLEFDTDGLDGSGIYLLLVEKTATLGTATMVTVTPIVRSTCAAPSNDRCSSPLALTSGNGIDPLAPTPNVPRWADALKGNTFCATKQRITRTTPGNPATGLVTTEDHYSYTPRFSTQPRYTGNLGDISNFFGRSQADSYLENTVFYTFRVTQTSSDWKIAIGNTGGCPQEPNNVAVMVFSSLDCNNAANSVRIATSKVSMDNGVAAGLPAETYGLTLNANQDYYIVVDGTRASQCDYCILIYNGSEVNPILPAELLSFDGYNRGRENIIQWETQLEENHDFFSVEKSLDGENFFEIGRLDGQGNPESGQAYNFIDPKAEVGINYYRLNMVDVNGSSYISNQIQILRGAPEVELLSVYPNPSQDLVNVLFAAQSPGTADIAIVDLRGKIVRRESFSSKPGEQQVELSLADVPAGIYALQIRIGSYTRTQKLIKL